MLNRNAAKICNYVMILGGQKSTHFIHAILLYGKGQIYMSIFTRLKGMQMKRGFRLVGLFGLAAILPAISACTTVEGTNALVDPNTFEREVMNETLQGIGVLDREEKDDLETPRAPLVLPGETASLPQPTQATEGVLPEDSDTVQIDVTNISDEMLARLRNARVVDLRSLSGRPLSEAETRQLTARMTADRLHAGNNRPLYLPPDHYFTTINNQDLICLAPNGDLVPLNDPRCPPEIRAALQSN